MSANQNTVGSPQMSSLLFPARLPARDFLEGFETMRTGKSGKIVLDWTQI